MFPLLVFFSSLSPFPTSSLVTFGVSSLINYQHLVLDSESAFRKPIDKMPGLCNNLCCSFILTIWHENYYRWNVDVTDFSLKKSNSKEVKNFMKFLSVKLKCYSCIFPKNSAIRLDSHKKRWSIVINMLSKLILTFITIRKS
jgi:hypothetical protein